LVLVPISKAAFAVTAHFFMQNTESNCGNMSFPPLHHMAWVNDDEWK